MGSSGTRKPADRLRVNTPMDGGNGAGGVGGQSGGNTPPQDINNVCPLTIQTKLARQDTPIGAWLVLDGNTLRLAADQGMAVGATPAAIIKTLQTCLGLGINYPTIRVVEDKQGVRYAEFAQ
jgi:hypothetical protein